MNFPITFQVSSADNSWRSVVRHVLCEGERHDLTGHTTNPVKQEIIETRGVTAVINAERPMMTDPRRIINYRFAAAEPLAFLRGSNRLATYQKHIKNFGRFSDDGIFMSSGYGPEIARQLPYIVRELVSNPMSRRAVLTVWRQNPDTSNKDIACLVSLQFIVRNKRLQVISNQRSQDMNLGFPYDVFTYAMIGRWVAGAVNHVIEHGFYHGDRSRAEKILSVGDLIHNMGSCHVYRQDEEKLKYLVENNPASYRQWPPLDTTAPSSYIEVEQELDTVSNTILMPDITLNDFFYRMCEEAERT